MKTIDEREMQKPTKGKQAKAESSKGNWSYSERVRAKWFCFPIKLGFLQLICKASLIFNFLFLKLRIQIFPKNFLFYYDVTSLFTNIPLQETIDIAINLIFNYNPNLNITKKELKKFFLFATSQTHFILTVSFIIKSME